MNLKTPTIPSSLKKSIFVYIDRKPDGEMFYVGVGDAARVGMRRRHRNKHHEAVTEKYDGCYRELFCVAPTREYANLIEQKLIAAIGRSCNQTGPLTNKSAGGDGYVDPSPEIRAARSKAMTGKRWKNKPGANAAAVEASRHLMIGNTHSLGFKHTEATRGKMSAAAKGKSKSTHMRKALSEARHARNAKVSLFLEQTCANIPKKKVTNAMMAAWFDRGIF